MTPADRAAAVATVQVGIGLPHVAQSSRKAKAHESLVALAAALEEAEAARDREEEAKNRSREYYNEMNDYRNRAEARVAALEEALRELLRAEGHRAGIRGRALDKSRALLAVSSPAEEQEYPIVPTAKRGGYQPTAHGPAPTEPPPKPASPSPAEAQA